MIKYILKINGMMCGMCESHINDVVRRNFEIKKVSSSHKKGLTTIIAENEIDENELKKKISETGYDLVAINKEDFVKKNCFSKFKL